MIEGEMNIGPRQATDESRREDQPRRMVVYGAAGSIGSALDCRLAGTHDLLLVDRQPMEGPRNKFVRCDVRDPDTFRQTMPGADASVYLPFAPYRPFVDMCNDMSGASFDVNARGVYYWLAAALKCGVRRLVLTSSLSVYGYDMPDVLTKDVPTTPADVYGLTKTCGEEICRYFARKHGMSIVVLRLCGICKPDDWTRPEAMEATWFLRWNRSHHRCPRTHIEDAIDAVVLALTRPFDGFHLFHVFGEHGLRDWPTDDQREELGFTPRYPRFGDTSPAQ